jgi:soluble lytic murein transglycosylase-like protein
VTNRKIALFSILTATVLNFTITKSSYADNIPESFINAVKQQKMINEGKEDIPFAQAVKLQKSRASLDSTNIKTGSNKDYKIFIKSYNPALNKATVEKIASNVTKYSNVHNVNPKLVLALMARESNFRSNVVSNAGAIGLGQLKADTAKDMGVGSPFNIIENIKGTVKYLSFLMKRFGGNVDMTLASYNMGPNAVQRTINKGISLPYSVVRYVSDIKNFSSRI